MMMIAVFLGGLVWMAADGPLSDAAGWSGLSLLDARVGVVLAIAMAVLAGVPAVVGGWLAAWAGRRLAGAMVVSGALLFLAAAGGGVSGFIDRTQAAPWAYGWLIVESALWAAGLIAFLAVLAVGYRVVRPRLPRWLITAEQEKRGLPEREGWTWRVTTTDLPAVAVAVAVGLVVTHAVISTPDPRQAMGGLVLAFLLATLAGKLTASDASEPVLLLTPMIVAAIGYAYILLAYSSGRQVEAALYTNRLTGLALAMPIHYASAGTLGAVLGIALAEGSDGEDTHAAGVGETQSSRT